MDAAARLDSDGTLEFAKQIIGQEAEALSQLAARLDEQFLLALAQIESCRGSIVVTGMGKAGLIGQKISATLCSTGSRSFFLHPAEAIHGDLGRVSNEDTVVVLSMSGETAELTRLMPSLREISSGIVAITSDAESTLSKQSDVVIALGKLTEADANGLAPSTSTAAMLAVGDALALTLSHRRGFSPKDFVQFHPGGSLGRKLARVSEMMRGLDECRVAHCHQSVRDTFVTLRRQGRRTGAVIIVDKSGVIAGIFTDSDLARLLESGDDQSLNVPVREVMTSNPHAIDKDALMPEAIRLLAEHQISELPVIDDQNRPVGLIDITDLVSWLPSTDGPHPKPRLLQFPKSTAKASS